MRKILALALIAAVAACADEPEPITGPSDTAPVDATLSQGSSSDAIPGQFIVTLRPGTNPAQTAQDHGVTPRYFYNTALTGFAGKMSEAARSGLLRDQRVVRIEQDQIVTIVETQSDPTWGLDRVDQEDLPLNDAYVYGATGSGVTAYIIDTGIRISHNDFGSRASYGYDAVDGDSDADDCNGHGTHVAGTTGGTEYGVAKSVDLVAVRVLDCNGSGTVSGVIAGVDWVTENAATHAVANMSLGGGASTSLDDAVRNSIEAGVTYSVAAGNGSFPFGPSEACDGSPSGVTEAITVGATDQNDNEASFSNYGECVDILAPGVSITSAWINNDDDTNTISGTSMAAPHVAGAAALYLEGNSGASPADVEAALVSNASADKVSLNSTSASAGTPNLLLYTGFIADGGGDDGGDGGGTNNPPTADFTSSCSDLTCIFTDDSGDSDGSIVTWNWAFGDGASSSEQNPSHTYGAGGSYTVTLTVMDDEGATDTASEEVTVSAADDTDPEISLSVEAYKVRGRQHADLEWSGASGTNVDVYRDGTHVALTENNGFFIHATDQRGGGSAVYQVCEEGTSTCSPEVNATW